MMADRVPSGGDAPDDFRVTLGLPADQEEGGDGAKSFEFVKQARRVLRVRAVVERQADGGVAARPAFEVESARDRAAERSPRELPPAPRPAFRLAGSTISLHSRGLR